MSEKPDQDKVIARPIVFILFVLSFCFWGRGSAASQEVRQGFTLDGKLYSDATATAPLIGTGTLKIQILDSAETCVLYEESQSYDTTATSGAFNIEVGEATSPIVKRTAGDSGHALADLFLNDGSLVTGKLISNGSACTGSATAGSQRYVRITVTPTSGSPRVLSPNLPLSSIPSAMVAESAQSLSGKTASQFIQVNTTAPASLSQSNLENVFSTTNYPKLTDLLAGNSSSYVKAMTNSSIQIPSSGSTPSTPQAGQIWYEGGALKYWDGSSAQALGVSGAGLSSLIIGTGLTPTGTINTGGQTVSVDVGIGTGQIVAVQAGNKLPVLDGSSLTNLKDTAISGDLSVTSITTSGSGSVGANLTVTSVTSTGELWTNKLKLFDGANSIELAAPTLSGSTSFTLPSARPGVSGYVLSSDTSGVMTWVPQNSSGLSAVSNTATLTQDKIWIGDSGGKAQEKSLSGDVSLVASGAATVTGIRGAAVSAAPTATGQVLRYNQITSELEPAYLSMFDLRSTLTGSSAFGGVGCLSNQTLTWTAATDNLACSDISLPATQITGSLPASSITNTAAGNIASATVQAALNELDTEKVAKNGDTMTGTLTLPANGLVVGTNQFVITGGNVLASGSVGIGTTGPGTSLDLSQKTDAIAIPSGTTAQRPSSPVNGYTRYNADMKGVEAYINGSWQQVGAGTSPTASEDGQSLRWNNTTKQFDWFTAGAAGSGIGTLNGLTASSQNFGIGTGGFAPNFDSQTSTHTLNIPMANTVSVTAGLISKTEYDTFNSKLGTSTSFSGDVSGSYNATSVDKIKGKAVTTPTASGQMLVYDGTGIAPVVMSGDGSMLADGTMTLKNTGTAGTYTKVTTDAQGRVAIGTTLTASDIPDLDWAKITTGKPTTLAGYGITDGVTSIEAGSGLSGGTISSTGTISLSAATQNGLWTGDGTNVWRAGGNVGIGTNAPVASLDLAARTDAVALPSGTTAQRPSSPVNGYTRYNTDMKGVEAYINGAWQQIGAGSSPTASEDGKSLKWNNTTKQFDWFTAGAAGSGIGTLNGLTASSQSFGIGTGGLAPNFDSQTSTHTLHIPMANTASVTAGLISKTEYDTFNSKLGTGTSFSGDVSGSYSSTSVDKIKGKAVTTPTTSGQMFVYDGTGITPVVMSGDATMISDGTMTLKNTGSVGTYFKVTTDAQGRVTSGATGLGTTEIPDLPWSKITSGIPTNLAGYGINDAVQNAGGTPSIQSGLDASKPSSGWTAGRIYIASDAKKIYRDDGSAWVEMAPATASGVTSITAGSGLSGGTISTSGTIALSTAVQNGLWTGDGTDVWRAGGNVGIGTVTPGTRLHVFGTVSSDLESRLENTSANSVATAQWTAKNNSGDRAMVGMASSANNFFGGTSGVAYMYSESNAGLNLMAGVTAAPIRFFTGGVGAGAERVRIDGSGNVGIGTTGPGTSLDLSQKTDAIALPSGTTAQRPTSPVNGYTRYNTDMRGVEAYINGSWQQVGAGSSPTASEDGMSLRWNNTTKQFDWFTAGAAGSGIGTLNGLTAPSQNFAIGTGGLAPNFDSQTSTHTLHIPMANTASVTAGLISKTEYDTFNNKLGTGTSLSGDVSGSYNSTSVDKIKGKAVSAAPTTTGQILRYNNSTSQFEPAFLSMFDLRSTVTGSAAFGGVGCLSNQTLTWTAATDNLACTDIALPASQISGVLPVANGGTGTNALEGTFVLNGGQPGNLNVGTNDSTDLILKTDSNPRMTLLSSGEVGIGVTNPGTRLQINDGTDKNLFVTGVDFGAGTGMTLRSSNDADNTDEALSFVASKFYFGTGSVGIGTTSPNVSLDVGAKTDAIALPSGTTAERPSSPANGYARYNTDMKGVEAYVNGGWQQIASGVSPTAGEDGMSLRWNNTTKQFDWFTAGAAGSGIGTLNGLTATSQNFAIGTGGLAPNFDSQTSTHTLHIPMANTASVTAGLISKADYDAFNSKLGTATSLSGDVSGTYNNTSVDKIKGKTVSAAPTLAGQVLRYDGTNFVPNFISMFDLRSTVTGSAAFGGVGCLSNQTLTWTSATDNLACSNISLPASQVSGVLPVANGGTGTNSLPATFVLNGGQAGAVSAGTNDASALTLKTNNLARVTVDSSGLIGIGTSSPAASALLDVNSTTKGFLPPRMTTAQRSGISSPAAGLIVFDTDLGDLYLYKNSAWSKLADETQVAFRINRNGVDQSISNNTNTKINWTTEDYDTGSAFNTTTSQFLPTTAGYYYISVQTTISVGSGKYHQVEIHKNGADVAQSYVYNDSSGSPMAQTSTVLYLNGSTDYVDFYVVHNNGSASPLLGNSYRSFASGFLISGGSGGGGGVADNLGSHVATQNIVMGGNWISGDGDNEGIRIDGSGNVGIGTVAPTHSLEVVNSSTASPIRIASSASGSGGGFITSLDASHMNLAGGAEYNGSAWVARNTTASMVGLSSGAVNFAANGGLTAGNTFTPTVHMTVTSSGSVGIGTNNPASTLSVDGIVNVGNGSTTGAYTDGTRRLFMNPNGAAGGYIWSTIESGNSQNNLYLHRHSTSGAFATLAYGTSAVGSITTNGSSTSYNTTSDYRLKENIVEMSDAVPRLLRLRPKRFNFKTTPGRTVDGFIAHEVAEVVPEAVTGKKDAVDEKGGIVPQVLDHSKLVPLIGGALHDALSVIDIAEAPRNAPSIKVDANGDVEIAGCLRVGGTAVAGDCASGAGLKARERASPETASFISGMIDQIKDFSRRWFGSDSSARREPASVLQAENERLKQDNAQLKASDEAKEKKIKNLEERLERIEKKLESR